MKLARAFFFLIVFGSSAIAAHAQTPLPPPASGGAGDPRIVFPDACPANASCATLTVPGNGTLTIPDCTASDTLSECLAIGLVIDVASPISVGPGLNSLWFCTQDAPPTFSEVAALGTINGLPGPIGQNFAPQVPNLGSLSTGTFTGCEYWSGTISGSVGIAEVGGITPLIVPEDLGGGSVFPEPRTSVLFMSGLLLIFLGGIARKRFGTTSRT